MKTSKHDKIVNAIKTRLERRSLEDILIDKMEFDLRGNIHGEADCVYVNIHKDYAYLFEVKTTNTSKGHKKARYQLLKDIYFIRKYFDIENIWGFYSYSNSAFKPDTDIHLEFHYKDGHLYDFYNKRHYNLSLIFDKEYMERIAHRLH